MSSLIAGERELGSGAIEPLSFQFDDYTSIEVVSVEAYKNGSGSDVSAFIMPSGSHGAAGNILTTKPVQSLTQNAYYILRMIVTVNGTTQRDERYFRLVCPNAKSGLVRTN